MFKTTHTLCQKVSSVVTILSGVWLHLPSDICYNKGWSKSGHYILEVGTTKEGKKPNCGKICGEWEEEKMGVLETILRNSQTKLMITHKWSEVKPNQLQWGNNLLLRVYEIEKLYFMS